MRNAAINLRARGEQRDLIDQAASLLGKNRTDFMLEASCEKAQSVLLDQVFFALDPKAFKRFIALLEQPPKSNPALERLLVTPLPWEAPAKKSSRTKRA